MVGKWRCDICQKRTFDSLDEATIHEATCQGIQQQPVLLFHPRTSIMTSMTSMTAVLASAPATKNAQAYAAITATADQSRTKQKKLPKQQVLSQQRRKNNGDNAPDNPPAKKPKTATTTISSSYSARPKASSSANTSSTTAAKAIHPFFTKRTTMTTTTTTTANNKRTRTKIAVVESSPPMVLNVDNVDEATRSDQQRAWEFFSSKNKKKQTISSKTTSTTTTSRTSSVSSSMKPNDHETSTHHKQQKRKNNNNNSRGKIAPKFPIPNHIVPAAMDNHSPDGGSWTLSLVPPRRRRQRSNSLASCHHTPVEGKSGDLKVWLTDQPIEESTEPDVLLARAIAECMANNPLPTSFSSSSQRHRRGDCWVERFYHQNVDNIVSTSVQDAVKSFIERFKIDRWQSNTRRQERHDRKMKNTNGTADGDNFTRNKKKKQRRPVSYDSDDDDWFDDDDDDDSLLAKTTLCLLTGPTGSGKSSLVYHMAARLECRSVLELHPGEIRSGAMLRKFMEEATKSHSTKDMLFQKNNGRRCAATDVATTTIFDQKTKREQKQQQPLVDSSDDDDDATTLANQHHNNNKGVAVTIILLDEVDTLFESDAGFWSALSELAKTSKCPIILTANRIPTDLKSPYTHIVLDRPSVSECAAKLAEIAAQAEGSECSHNNNAVVDWEKVAMLGECDMRRIIYAMHAYSLAPRPTILLPPVNGGGGRDENICANSGSKTMVIEASPPIVERVEPSSILAHEITCLTILGKNFSDLVDVATTPSCCSGSQTTLEVIIGDQVCPYAKVLDDTTILAVCQPRRLPRSIDCQGFYHGSRRRSLATTYQSVIVRSNSRRRGGVANSSAAVVLASSVTPNAGEARLLSQPTPVCVDVQFHGFTKETDEDDEENELQVYLNSSVAGPCSITNDDVPADLLDRCLSVFNDAIAKQKASNETIISRIDRLKGSTDELFVMDNVLLDCQLSSDAALFHDVGLSSVPFLSGPCRGLGFTVTHEYPRRTNENSKPPGYQRLFEERWNEDCFFMGAADTYVQSPPRNVNERRLLIQAEQAARGLSLGVKETNVIEDEEFREHVYDDEDMFVHNPVPMSIRSLPSILRSGCETWKDPSPTRCRLVDQSRARVKLESLDFLTSMVYAGDTKLRFRFDALDRCFDALNGGTEQGRHRVYFLDYLSIIRCCVVSDRAPMAEDDTMGRPGRRSTRRTRRRQAFLEGLVPSFARQGDAAAQFDKMSVTLYENALHLCHFTP